MASENKLAEGVLLETSTAAELFYTGIRIRDISFEAQGSLHKQGLNTLGIRNLVAFSTTWDH